MIGNEQIYNMITGDSAVIAYFGENVFHQVLPKDFTQNSILYSTKILQRFESLDEEIFAYLIGLTINIITDDEVELEATHQSLINTCNNFASINIDSIEFREDFLDFDEDLDKHVLSLDFVFNYSL